MFEILNSRSHIFRLNMPFVSSLNEFLMTHQKQLLQIFYFLIKSIS